MTVPKGWKERDQVPWWLMVTDNNSAVFIPDYLLLNLYMIYFITMQMIACSLLTSRECDGQPWGFLGQPAPAPVKTHTRLYGCGFLRAQVTGFTINLSRLGHKRFFLVHFTAVCKMFGTSTDFFYNKENGLGRILRKMDLVNF